MQRRPYRFTLIPRVNQLTNRFINIFPHGFRSDGPRAATLPNIRQPHRRRFPGRPPYNTRQSGQRKLPGFSPYPGARHPGAVAALQAAATATTEPLVRHRGTFDNLFPGNGFPMRYGGPRHIQTQPLKKRLPRLCSSLFFIRLSITCRGERSSRSSSCGCSGGAADLRPSSADNGPGSADGRNRGIPR